MTATLSVQTIGKTDVHVGDMDTYTAREIVTSVENFYRDFPKIAAGLGTVQCTADENNGKGSYAYTRPADLHSPVPPFCIVLNPLYFGPGTRKALTDGVAGDYAAHFHAYWQPAGVIEHELGHVLDMTLAGKIGLSRPLSLLAITNEDDANSVSGYGWQSGPVETFADAFANWRTGIRPGNANIQQVVREFVTAAGGHYV
jgi:hypothetical protein